MEEIDSAADLRGIKKIIRRGNQNKNILINGAKEETFGKSWERRNWV